MITNAPSFIVVLAGCLLCWATGAPAITVEIGGGGGSLISAGDEWNYFKGTTAPSTPADAWQEVGFNDSGWLSGASGFGYDDGDDFTVLDDMRMTATQDGYATVYVRKEFDLATVPAGTLELVIDYDDGFVAYINGEEIERSSSMPAGTPTFATTSGSHEAGTAETFVLGNAADILAAGTNVIAIEGHNTTLTSTDFSLIPALRTTSGLVQIGGTWIVGAVSPNLSCTVTSASVSTVTIDGAAANYDAGSMQWDGAPVLTAGLNTVLVEALDASSTVIESATMEIIYVPPGNEVSGTLASSVSWSGAVLVEGVFTVPTGVVLTIEPGTQLLMKPGAALVVNGQLLAAGTESEPIRFTHYGDGTTWERIMLVGAEDSVMKNCVVEYSDCEGDHKDYYDDDCDEATPLPPRTYFQAVVAIACHLDIEDCLFQNLPDDSSSAEGDAIAIISDDADVPGEATANIRRSDFIGIGQGIHTRFSYVLVEDCFFTGHNGDNDDIDLYGESTPPPLILNNRLIDPGHDDMINPTRCSAILIGNVIAGSDDHGIVLRDKCQPILINNLIYDCSSGGIAIQNQCDALLINNTIVDCGRGIRCFDHTGRWGPPYCLFPGSGSATLINCVIWNCPTAFTLENSPWTGDMGSHLTVSYCNVEGGQGRASVSTNSTLTWGAGNTDSEPGFLDEAGGDFRLESAAGRWDAATQGWIADATTSPCVDSGTDVRAAYSEIAAWLARDFDGIARPLDGDGNSSPGIDMGAHEVITESADSSGDGIPDGWSFRYGLNPLDPGLANGNPDHDPQSTGEEWLADTDPTDANSWLKLSGISFVNSVVVSFESSVDRLYTLWSSIDLITWETVEGQIDQAGSGGPDSLIDEAAAPRSFYRVEAKLP